MTKADNFHLLRFLFALFVVISHCYSLSGTPEASNWLCIVTANQLNFSQIGLGGFFVISGYFIFQSLTRSSSIFEYYKKRFLRLFPALFVVLLLSLLLIPFIYDGPVSLLKNRSYWTYLPYNLSLYGFQGIVKGVFDDNYYHSINGSLWTIRYEFSLYIALSFLFYIKSRKVLLANLLLFFFGLFYVLYNFYLSTFENVNWFNLLGIHVLNLGTYFIAGSALAALNFKNWKNRNMLALVAFLFILLTIYFGYFTNLKHLFFPIFILGLGFFEFSFLSCFSKFGDASYGIYIYSFPIQQSLVYFGFVNYNQLLIFSGLFSVIFGYLSWHFIEKKALLLKKSSNF